MTKHDENQDEISYTGERLVINDQIKQLHPLCLEQHLQRYIFASDYVKGKNILDAACGSGYGTKILYDAGALTCTGIDISNESVKYAQKTYGSNNISYTLGDVNKLSFNDGSFDVIVSFETIEHINNGQTWIKESARLLNENGLFIISTPNRSITNPGAYFNDKPTNPYHMFEYNTLEFIGELLCEYDIMNLYGQALVDGFKRERSHKFFTYRTFIKKILPQTIKSMSHKFRVNNIIPDQKNDLVPFSDIKNLQPTFIIAVCKKKHINNENFKSL